MTDEQYPDLFNEAAQVGTRELLQVGSAVMMIARVCLQHQARKQREQAARDEREKRALRAQAKAERDAIRARWAPANDGQWVRSADLADTAAAWCAAVPYTNSDTEVFEPSALTAVENCEARLRELHPYAMARYDRLRADGLDRIEAVREAAPLFMNAPYVREHGGRARAAIAAEGLGHPWIDAVHGPGREEFDAYFADKQVSRGTEIIEDLQVRALADGRPLLDDDEQRTALESATNLPPAVIDRVVPRRPAPAGSGLAAGVTRKPWQQDFPFTIEDVVAVAAHRPSGSPEGPTAPKRSARPAKGGKPRGHA